ncbi:hypothetical protein [Sinomonas gamaensis]|uniref:hypothetical protein n=1 Tax=Sinomonas gamaensis TaxID=2565624 RepID=UPI00110816F0|nr:hypothetical protein [Sinomonas gamaensis]
MEHLSKAHAPDHPIYAKIRALSAVASEVFDELEVQPLFDDPDGVLSVDGWLPAESGDDLELTLWRPTGEAAGLCLLIGSHIDQGKAKPEHVYRLTPEPPSYGLELPDSGTAEGIRRALVPMTLIFELAEPTHLGLHGVERDRSLQQLNEAVVDGFDSGLSDVSDEAAEERGASIVEEIQLLCATGICTHVSFEYNHDLPSELATHGILDTADGDESALKVWTNPDEDSIWVSVNGNAHQYDPEAEAPNPKWHPDEGVRRLLAEAISDLCDIHFLALLLFAGTVLETKTRVAGSLTGYAAAAIEDPDDEDQDLDFEDEVFEDWRDSAEAFAEHCKLPLFGGVTLQEGPYGELNIAGTTHLGRPGENVELKVYWHLKDPDSEPEHWLAVGNASGPAHLADPAYPELLKGFPEECHDHLRHAIGHLHQMVHLAADVVAGKAEEARDYLEQRTDEGQLGDMILQTLESQSVSDAIEGLNGVARLYTGSMPEWAPLD